MLSYFEGKKSKGGFPFGRVFLRATFLMDENIQGEFLYGPEYPGRVYLRASLPMGELTSGENSSGEISSDEFVLGENFQGEFTYQSARARTFRSTLPIS